MGIEQRRLIAFAVSPLWPAFWCSPAGLNAFFFAALLGYLGFILLGLPSIIALRHFKKLNFISLVMAGAITGALFFTCFTVALVVALGAPAGSGLNAVTILWGTGLGTLVAVTFGLIAGPKNLEASIANSL